MGNYLGNNYESCVITSREALKNYPFSKLTEEFQILILRARFDLADNSIEERKPLRFRDVIDEYFNYQNMFPEGKYTKESQAYYKKALELLGENAPETIIKTDDIKNN
ncbi:MAG: hypothetical protein LBR34_02685 [Prevotella sp.]|jgi:outer membrane protein assembly factor BamD|nr:hypothetical protein [Prevotella sp.]